MASSNFGGVTTLVDASGAPSPLAAALDHDVVGLYFSAHWCPPCRGFTPKLSEWYTARKAAGASLEIVFLSSDRDEDSFKHYAASMPWKSLPFSESAAKESLSRKFSVRGIPMLVFLRRDGSVLSTDGRALVMNDPEGFPWAGMKGSPAPSEEEGGCILA